MTLLDEIQQDILDDQVRVSTILRKTKILAHHLKHDELRRWLDAELLGYQIERDDLPDYRRGEPIIRADFVGYPHDRPNVLLQEMAVPMEFRNIFKHYGIGLSTREVEVLLETPKQEFIMEWPANLAASFSNRVYQGMDCVAMRSIVMRPKLEQILDGIRTSLLNFILELQSLEVSKDPLTKEVVSDILNKQIMGVDRGQLYKQMISGFGIEDIKHVCWEMYINYDRLKGEELDGKIRDLITHCEQTTRIIELLNKCAEQRPNIQWVKPSK